MIKSWHVSEEKIHTIDFIGHRDAARGLAVDRDGDARWVLSTGHAEDGAVNIWALCNGVFVGELAKVVNTAYHNGPVISIDFCNKIRIFATAARDEVRLCEYLNMTSARVSIRSLQGRMTIDTSHHHVYSRRCRDQAIAPRLFVILILLCMNRSGRSCE